MFVDWLCVGVGFGIKAFFAVLVFVCCIAAILGIIGFLGNIMRIKSGDDNDLGGD